MLNQSTRPLVPVVDSCTLDHTNALKSLKTFLEHGNLCHLNSIPIFILAKLKSLKMYNGAKGREQFPRLRIGDHTSKIFTSVGNFKHPFREESIMFCISSEILRNYKHKRRYAGHDPY